MTAHNAEQARPVPCGYGAFTCRKHGGCDAACRAAETAHPPHPEIKACPRPDCPGWSDQVADECAHEWLDRPESDTRECLICGVERHG